MEPRSPGQLIAAAFLRTKARPIPHQEASRDRARVTGNFSLILARNSPPMNPRSAGCRRHGRGVSRPRYRLDRTVAVKVLASHLSSSPELKQRMEREGRAISSLNHPHICQLYDIGSQNGTDYLVMEFLEGETLVEKLRNRPLPPSEVYNIGMEVAEALAVAHRTGLVPLVAVSSSLLVGSENAVYASLSSSVRYLGARVLTF